MFTVLLEIHTWIKKWPSTIIGQKHAGLWIFHVLLIKFSGYRMLEVNLNQFTNNAFVFRDQSSEFKFRFVFFRFQMLCFSALCWPNEQKFGTLLTWPKGISPHPKFAKSVHRELRNATFEGEKMPTSIKRSDSGHQPRPPILGNSTRARGAL